ncbi:single-stranded-DNA-specific exonuclease [Agaricicola taiwanensis]|uniref:Single-stranded-DNA-specific exonuclease RecJ n=1 Tax=Agaricicola taiwanensis TaxID=591372 RepID=A0A8J2YIB7_9RHOB|nr:single-stranded-DNA-specific exonuclease RecJ [Agaricicola taiwanensis]GGE45110.1 single-stranded-DNA-specific exonuclease [Agaricicola taiwanensis]
MLMRIATALALEPGDTAFLGVHRSATGRRWRERLDGRGQALALAMAQAHGIPDLLARVIAGRGVQMEEVARHLDPTLRALMPDPSTLTDMDQAAERLAAAIRREERVAIFGDYDVDGATSAAILGQFLRACGTIFDIHIPDRIFEGYGPNVPAIRDLAARGAKLLVTVDCGTTSHEALAEARKLGLDVVVLDHHQAPEDLPAATALVNPNRLDDVSGQGHLAACGVVFLAIVATARTLRHSGYWTTERPQPDLLAFTDLAALGTVADVVPLVGVNRALVATGLKAMAARLRPGTRALMDVARMDAAPSPYHLGFLLGPRINAGGRIGNAALGARLLLSADPVEAMAIAAELDRLNEERRAVEAATLAEADAQVPEETEDTVIVTSGQGWHPGVVGLVSARLKEKFCRPAFAFAIGEDGLATGSGRSIPGVDLGGAVREAVDEGIAIKGGGHAMAAGVTLAAADIPRFQSYLSERLASDVTASQAADALTFDGALSAGGATADLTRALQRGGPYGTGNSEPTFAFPNHTLVSASVVGTGHIRIRIRSGDGATVSGIAFRCADRPLGRALVDAQGRMVHLAGRIAEDTWGGGSRIEIRVCDLAVAG